MGTYVLFRRAAASMGNNGPAQLWHSLWHSRRGLKAAVLRTATAAKKPLVYTRGTVSGVLLDGGQLLRPDERKTPNHIIIQQDQPVSFDLLERHDIELTRKPDRLDLLTIKHVRKRVAFYQLADDLPTDTLRRRPRSMLAIAKCRFAPSHEEIARR